MRANRSVRAAGYPVEKTSVSREMGKKTVYVYVGRPVTEQERQDITIRVLGAVPNATEVVVYPLPGATAPTLPGNSTPRPNTADGAAPATQTPGAQQPATQQPATQQPAAQQPATQPNPNSQPRNNTPQAGQR